MFRDLHDDYHAFFDYGIGAMCWRVDEDGTRFLVFLAPDDLCPSGYTVVRIRVMTDGKDWTHPGPVSGWDGNLERPTFNPSIWVANKKGWHGYIRDGNLVDA